MNLVDNSALSLGSYPGHEGDPAAEFRGTEFDKGAVVRTYSSHPLVSATREMGLFSLHGTRHKVSIIRLVVLFMAPALCFCLSRREVAARGLNLRGSFKAP